MLLIILNGALTFWSANYLIANIPQGPTTFMKSAELFFLVLFTTEVIVKLIVHRGYYFISEDAGWDCFDIVLVVSSIGNYIVENYASDYAFNVTFLRSARLLKVVRILRIFRLLRFFNELRLILNCLFGCMQSLFWAIVLLTFLMGMFAVFFVQDVTNYMTDQYGELNQEVQDDFLGKFGTVGKSMITLCQAVTGGDDWGQTWMLLLRTGMISPTLFVFYIILFMIAIWNIVTSLFVDRAMKLAAPDLESLMFERRSQDLADARELMALARKLDTDDSGTISMKELVEFFRNDNFRAYFVVRGIEIKDAVSFFRMLASISGCSEIELQTFVQGCLRLKGAASSIDLATLHYECEVHHNFERQFRSTLLTRLEGIEQLLIALPVEGNQLSRNASGVAAAATTSAAGGKRSPGDVGVLGQAGTIGLTPGARSSRPKGANLSPADPQRGDFDI
jgi:hypothetical protein